MQDVPSSEDRTQGGRGKMLLVIIVLVGVLGTVYALTDNRSGDGNPQEDEKENGVMTKDAGDEVVSGNMEDGKGPGDIILERAGMK